VNLPKGVFFVSQKTGWLEKWHDGRILSMVEVQYHRVHVKKTPRKKAAASTQPSHRDESLYYVLDKKVSLGELTLTGNSVFSNRELVEVALPLAQHRSQLRLLGKVMSVTTFIEMKRVVFRAKVHFAAVSKEDFDRLAALEARKSKMTPPSGNPSREKNSKLRMTFKRT
jgi:hypothetical protein